MCSQSEFKVPKKADQTAAVADAKRAQEQADAAGKSDGGDSLEEEAAVADVWVWGPPGQVTMNPFWAVRQMIQAAEGYSVTAKAGVLFASIASWSRTSCLVSPLGLCRGMNR